MLNHKIDAKHLRTLEELGKYAFPSAPKDSLQSLILAEIPTLGLKKEPDKLLVEFCNFLITLWTKCYKEKYVCLSLSLYFLADRYQIDPMYLLIDMLTFALELHTTIIAPFILDSLLSVAQDTVDAVAVSRFKSSVVLEAWAEDINTTPTMHLLYLTAQGCMSELEDIKRFWKQMRWQFAPVMLRPSQPEEDYLIMLKLLSTSVMKESFGAICLAEEQPLQMELIINSLCISLYEIPFIRTTNEPMPPDQLYRLRLGVLQSFVSMTRSPVASKAIAIHPDAIGKLVHLVSAQLDELYDYKSNTEEW
jgi:hypothetical protein